MIGKVIGAFVGDRIAKNTTKVGGATGAALGVVATSVLRRMSLPAMIAVGAGGYVVKKILDKQEKTDKTEARAEKTAPKPAAKTAPVTPKAERIAA